MLAVTILLLNLYDRKHNKTFETTHYSTKNRNMKFIQKCSLIAMIIAGVTCEVYAQSLTVFSNKNEEKIEKLIREMTLEEKIYQLGAYYYGRSEHSNANVRLGIPNLVAGESLHGAMADGATVFPIPIAMASSWDTNLIERMGHVVAKETRAFGIHQGYAPMIAVVRDTRWGRIEESYGEDPFLVGSIGTAYVKGLQGMGVERFDKNHIIACSKHFVADGEPMAGANGAAMDVSDYNLQNIHLYRSA
jgi:beta-glucosidase